MRRGQSTSRRPGGALVSPPSLLLLLSVVAVTVLALLCLAEATPPPPPRLQPRGGEATTTTPPPDTGEGDAGDEESEGDDDDGNDDVGDDGNDDEDDKAEQSGASADAADNDHVGASAGDDDDDDDDETVPQPEGIVLLAGRMVTQVVVTFTTPVCNSSERPVLRLSSQRDMTEPSFFYGNSDAYHNAATNWTQCIHRVPVWNLHRGVQYTYRVGVFARSQLVRDSTSFFSKRWGRVLMFSVPAADADRLSFAVVGDMGVYSAAHVVARLLRQHVDDLDYVVLLGDITYASNGVPPVRQERNTEWAAMMEPVLSQVPALVVPGNHEFAEDRFRHYGLRFPMPSAGGIWDVLARQMQDELDRGHAPAGSQHQQQQQQQQDRGGEQQAPPQPPDPAMLPQWYEADTGAVRWLTVSTNGAVADGIGDDTAQGKWLAHSVATAYQRHPPPQWLFLLSHVPPLQSTRTHAAESDQFAAALSRAIGVRSGIDASFAGHVHSYERSHPVRLSGVNGQPELVDLAAEAAASAAAANGTNGTAAAAAVAANNGTLFFVVGTGGAPHMPNFRVPMPAYTAVRNESIGFLQLDVFPGNHSARLRFLALPDAVGDSADDLRRQTKTLDEYWLQKPPPHAPAAAAAGPKADDSPPVLPRVFGDDDYDLYRDSGRLLPDSSLSSLLVMVFVLTAGGFIMLGYCLSQRAKHRQQRRPPSGVFHERDRNV